jgi:hypothetical protein
MNLIVRVHTLNLLVPVLGCLVLVEPCVAQDVAAPAKFTPVTDSFDYTRRDVMIPMWSKNSSRPESS